MIKIAYDSDGKPQLVHFLLQGSYLELPFDPVAKVMNWQQKHHETKMAFDQWIAGGGLLDLSDRPPESPSIPQSSRSYKGLYKALVGQEGISLFLHIRYVAGFDKDVNLAYVDTMSALAVGMIELPETDEQLQSCINVLFASMNAVDPSIGGGFSQSEIDLMRLLLDSHGFQGIVFPMGL